MTSRQLRVRYEGSTCDPRESDSGAPAGCRTGNLIFIVKFNGALLRPPIPRPISKNTAIQEKYIDDQSVAASINLRKSFIKDPVSRPKPLNFHERFELIIKPEENVIQLELDKLCFFTNTNKLRINKLKSSVMLFNNSQTMDFPPEIRVQNSEFFNEKTSTRLLGVIINNKANFEDNTRELVRRGTKKLWLLRRMKQLGLDPATVLKYWVSECRPLLEFSCPLWTGSISKQQSRTLESVQKSALAIAFNDRNLSYRGALVRAGLPRLDSRRLDLSRTWGLRAARQHGQTFFKQNTNNTRGAKPFLEPFCRTTKRRNSAIPFITRLLNN